MAAEKIELAWEEHYEYKYTLVPKSNNPHGTGGSNTERWEVIDQQYEMNIGRITKYDKEYAAYTHAGYGEFNKRIGFYNTLEGACKALTGTWNDYIAWGGPDGPETLE